MRDIRSEPTTDLVGPEAVMGFLLWPENPFWSFRFLRLIAEAYFGGADFTECYLAVYDLEAGDIEGWYERLSMLALSLEKQAKRAATDCNGKQMTDHLACFTRRILCSH